METISDDDQNGIIFFAFGFSEVGCRSLPSSGASTKSFPAE